MVSGSGRCRSMCARSTQVPSASTSGLSTPQIGSRSGREDARFWVQDRFGGLLAPVLIRSLNRHRMAAFNAVNAALKNRVEGTHPRPEA